MLRGIESTKESYSLSGWQQKYVEQHIRLDVHYKSLFHIVTSCACFHYALQCMRMNVRCLKAHEAV
jgi:hypothetical protein